MSRPRTGTQRNLPGHHHCGNKVHQYAQHRQTAHPGITATKHIPEKASQRHTRKTTQRNRPSRSSRSYFGLLQRWWTTTHNELFHIIVHIYNTQQQWTQTNQMLPFCTTPQINRTSTPKQVQKKTWKQTIASDTSPQRHNKEQHAIPLHIANH